MKNNILQKVTFFFLQTIYFHLIFKKGNSLENNSFKTLGKHLIKIIVLQKVTYLT